MNAKRKTAVERTVFSSVMTLFLAGAITVSAIMYTDSDYSAGLSKPSQNLPTEEAVQNCCISEPEFSYERYLMTFAGSINAGSMLGSSSYGTICGLYEEMGGEYFLEGMADCFLHDDLTFAFLSSIFSDSSEMELSEGGWYLAPSENADILSIGGVDALSLECSGVKNGGTDAYRDTKTALENVGVDFGDSGKAIYREHSSGVDVAVYPCTYREENLPGIISWIEKAASEHDFVVVAISSEGLEKEELSEAFHGFVDSGANLVVSTNCNDICEGEYYEDGYIAYSLGSLIDGANKYGEKTSELLECELIINEGKIERVEYRTVAVENYSDSKSWHPETKE